MYLVDGLMRKRVLINNFKNKKMFKKCKVVMLPTNEKATDNTKPMLWLGAISKQLRYDKNGTGWIDKSILVQHLYIISDKEIKDGWNYFESSNGMIKVITNQRVKTIGTYKGVIATTDKSLGVKLLEPHKDKYGDVRYNEFSNSLPQPSQSFIEKYIQSYNKGQQIVDVLVEYEIRKYDSVRNVINSEGEYFYDLKISKDNTITIKRIKNFWDREEVISKLNKAIGEAISYPEKFVTGICLDSTKTNNWIEQNL